MTSRGWVAATAAIALGVLSGCSAPRPEAGPLTLTASDGLNVYADWHHATTEPPVGTIALFHQGGGDVRGEYERILPRLLSLGYDVLAADLRRGGNRFGSENRTAPPDADSLYGYCDALPDVAAAVDEARRYSENVILWGSSFSGALVVHAAVNDPEGILGVLAFSPASGDPMEGCRPESVSGQLTMPFLAVRPAYEVEFPSVSAQLAEFEAQGHISYVADPGVHGSSLLDAERVGADTEAAWRVVETFLSGLPEVQ